MLYFFLGLHNCISRCQRNIEAELVCAVQDKCVKFSLNADLILERIVTASFDGAFNLYMFLRKLYEKTAPIFGSVASVSKTNRIQNRAPPQPSVASRQAEQRVTCLAEQYHHRQDLAVQYTSTVSQVFTGTHFVGLYSSSTTDAPARFMYVMSTATNALIYEWRELP